MYGYLMSKGWDEGFFDFFLFFFLIMDSFNIYSFFQWDNKAHVLPSKKIPLT